MQVVLPYTNPIARRTSVLLAIVVALIAIVSFAAYLPPTSYDFVLGSIGSRYAAPLRLSLLGLTYVLVAGATLQRSSSAWATALALLLAAAIGWAGWEWSTMSMGWPLFAALLFLLEHRGRRTAIAAAAIAIVWAAFVPGAIWGGLLLLAWGLGDIRSYRSTALIPIGAGLLVMSLLMARGFNVISLLIPPARTWVWADGQSTNTMADPIGFGLIAGLLALFGLWLLHPTKPSTTGLLAIGVFSYFTWVARRNGVWLGMSAAPFIAGCLSGNSIRWQRLILGAGTVFNVGLLTLAVRAGPDLLAGQPLSSTILAALPHDGSIVYRPTFEPALRHERSPQYLALAQERQRIAKGHVAAYDDWLRIEAACASSDEIKQHDTRAVVLDPRADAQSIQTLTTDHWQIAASDQTAVLLIPGSGR